MLRFLKLFVNCLVDLIGSSIGNRAGKGFVKAMAM